MIAARRRAAVIVRDSGLAQAVDDAISTGDHSRMVARRGEDPGNTDRSVRSFRIMPTPFADNVFFGGPKRGFRSAETPVLTIR